MQKFTWIVQLSRPRFWFYLLGPFLLGIAAYPYLNLSADLGNYQAGLLVALLFFTLPANLLIYGLNDLFDYETDKHNPKKKEYELMLIPSQRSAFLFLLGIIIIPSLFLLIMSLLFQVSFSPGLNLLFDPNNVGLISLLGFLFFGIGYSAPPIRAKIRPFIDSFFNILYIFPAFVAYGILSEQYPPLLIVVAATTWCMAMHAFSAIPDIAADAKAGLKTVATILGTNGTLLFCTLCYAISTGLTISYLGIWGLIGFLIYAIMMYLGYRARSNTDLFRVYTYFPYVNVVVGFFLFWVIVLTTRNIL